LEAHPPEDRYLRQRMWQRRELENYLCQRETLLAFAEDQGRRQQGELFGARWREAMEEAIGQVEDALRTLGKDPWSKDIKASDEFLEPLFERYYERLGLPNLMRKTDYHTLAAFVPVEAIDAEIVQALDEIAAVADSANGCEASIG
ncbi:MAG: heat shock 70 family protein, partial [Casimicrobiaceae bacterium]|nr:heat shock 70 family protein [Casimicrobiaceae bacterium]